MGVGVSPLRDGPLQGSERPTDLVEFDLAAKLLGISVDNLGYQGSMGVVVVYRPGYDRAIRRADIDQILSGELQLEDYVKKPSFRQPVPVERPKPEKQGPSCESYAG